MGSNGDWDNENVSADLARANLLRMRGDLQGAIDQCLSVLKRAPESVDAHILIAEIHEEMGDLGQASQWYELALDLDPRNPVIRQKLAAAQEEAKVRETAGTAKNLALPPDKPPTALYICIIAVIAIVVGFGAYLSEGGALGRKAAEAAVPPSDGTGTAVSIVAPGESQPKQEPSTGTNVSSGEFGLPEEDRTLMRSLAETTPAGATLVEAQQDPRSNGLTLTYSVVAESNEPTVAAEAARGALGKVLSAQSAVVRVAKAGKLTYIATVERTRLAEVETPAWKQANTDPNAWLKHVLQQEWGSAALTSGATSMTGETTATATPAGP